MTHGTEISFVTFCNKNGVLNTLFVSHSLTCHCWEAILAVGMHLSGRYNCGVVAAVER